MNRFVLSALAGTMASGLGFAGSETEEWATLDRDIENLASSVAPQGSGLGVSGFLIADYLYSGDIPVGANDLGGFDIPNARLNFSGSNGDYGFFVSLEAGSSGEDDSQPLGSSGSSDGVNLLDAYATFQIGDLVTGTFGQFRTPFLRSALLDENNLLFVGMRTANGEVWDDRDRGVMLNGTFEQLGWWVSVQNGSDSLGDELRYAGRVSFDALGTGPGDVEGAYGADDASSLMVAIAYSDDTELDDGEAVAFDAAYTMGAFSIAGEVVDYGDDLATIIGETPWAATASYMVSPEEYEVAVRFEDADDADDTTRLTVGVNRYITGHNAKWGVFYQMVDSDSDSLDADIFGVGLTVGV